MARFAGRPAGSCWWWALSSVLVLVGGFGCGEKTTAPADLNAPGKTAATKTPTVAPATAPATTPAPPLQPPTTTPPPTPPTPAPKASTRVGPPLSAIAADAEHFPAKRYRATVAGTPAPTDFKLSPEIECYGNFETMGVIATLPAGLKAEEVGRMRCYLNVAGRWRAQQDPVRVAATNHFASSIFWLQPETTYQVKVEVWGIAGQVTQTWYGEGRTRGDEAQLAQFRGELWVAQDGPADGDGSKEKPFKTLAQAVAQAQNLHGVHIQVKGGVYYEGDFSISGLRGREGQGIWISAAAGETVVIDGSNPELTDAGVWKPEADGLWSHPLEGKCQNVVLEDQKSGALMRLLPIFTVEELRSRTVAKHDGFAGSTFAKEEITGAFATDGKTIWLLPPSPLAQYRVHVGRGTRAFGLEKTTSFRLDGVTIRYFGKEDYSCAALVYDTSNVVIENCHFLFNDVGIWVKGNSSKVTVQNCDFLDGVAKFPFLMQKVGGCPLSFEAGVVNVDSKWSGRGLVIRGNHIENQFDGVHLCPWKVDEAVTNEVDFYNNVILNCVDDFIEVDGFSRNVRIFDNYMRQALTGVSIAQALDGPTYICYNVIADCGTVPATTREGNSGYPFKTNGGDGAEIGSGEVFFYHNTAYTTDPDSRAMLVKRPNWRKLTFRNNIWYGKKYGFECWKNPPSPVDFDYDNLFSADPAAALVVLNYKTKIATLAEVRSQLKWLEHGISADPKIVDEERGVYALQAGSACIDAGVLVPGINDFRSFGAAPDLGAFEVMGPGHD